MLPLARALQARGHRVTLFIRNLLENARLLSDETLAILPVPDLVTNLPGQTANASMATYLDIMGVGGFADPIALQTGIMTWNTLLDQARPDLVVADHSPMLMLACFGRYPAVQFADGFTLPPAHRLTFPRFRPGATPLVDPAAVLRAMQIVQKRFGHPCPRSVTEPFRTAARLVCTLPELDPYASQRRDPVLGPVGRLPAPLPQPVSRTPRFFAYLDLAHRTGWTLATALSRGGMDGELFARGMTEQAARALERNGLVIHREFQPLEAVLGRAHVVLHHGSNGTCCAALAAGRPQLIAPLQMEARLTADAVVAQGCGHLLDRTAGDSVLNRMLREIAQNATMIEQARRVAHRIQARGQPTPTATALATCESVLHGDSGNPMTAVG